MSGAEKYKSVWSGGASLDIPIEIKIEARIECDVITTDVEHVNLVVALNLYNTARNKIFDEEIVGHDDAFFNAAQPDVVRTRARAEIDHVQRLRL